MDATTGTCRLTWRVTADAGQPFALLAEDSLLVTRDTVVTLASGSQTVTWEPGGPLPWDVLWDTASFGVSRPGRAGSATVHSGCTT